MRAGAGKRENRGGRERGAGEWRGRRGARGSRRIRVIDLAERDYGRVLAIQRDLAERVAAGAEAPALLLVEHDPVVTVGRGNQAGFGTGRASPAAPPPPPARGLPVYQVERGGGVTYHGPGQLVGYPIVRLDDHDVRGFLRRLEQGLIDALSAFGLAAARREGATGVWLPAAQGEGGPRKIASIGIAVRRWVTFHGFALNVATDLAAFRGLDPCGFDASVMTSLERALGRPVSLAEAKAPVASAVAAALAAPAA